MAAPASSGSTRWFTVQKQFGPVQFKRIGVGYQNNTLWLLMDMTLGFAVLTIAANGLGIGSPLTSFSPRGHLDGASLAVNDPAVRVDGVLLAVASLPSGVTQEYLGEVTIAFEPYLIAAVASYARLNGHSSIFIFADVTGEFGGPPAFYVTGFMGGFGYNSQLTLPAPDKVYTFPFIAGFDDPAIFGSNPTPLDVLDVLSGRGGAPAWVTPSMGENWIRPGLCSAPLNSSLAGC